MSKSIFAAALMCTIFLLLGTYLFPADVIMWFASTSVIYTVFRIIMVIALVAVLVTNPPRNLYMRLGMGALAATLVAVGVGMLFADTLHVLDILLFMVLGTAFGIEALEFNEDELAAKVAGLREQYVQDHAVSTADQFQAIRAQLRA